MVKLLDILPLSSQDKCLAYKSLVYFVVGFFALLQTRFNLGRKTSTFATRHKLFDCVFFSFAIAEERTHTATHTQRICTGPEMINSDWVSFRCQILLRWMFWKCRVFVDESIYPISMRYALTLILLIKFEIFCLCCGVLFSTRRPTVITHIFMCCFFNEFVRSSDVKLKRINSLALCTSMHDVRACACVWVAANGLVFDLSLSATLRVLRTSHTVRSRFSNVYHRILFAEHWAFGIITLWTRLHKISSS